MIEPANPRHGRLERILARMAERRVADIMRQRQRFGQVLVESQCARHCPRNLRNLKAVGQADAEMIAIGRDEHLRLMPQAAKADRMDDPVAVALERGSRTTQFAERFEVEPTPAERRVTGISSARDHFDASFTTSCPASLLYVVADTPALPSALTSARASDDDFTGPASTRLVAL